MQFLPAEEKRWNFSSEIHAAGIRISQVLRDFNNLTLTSTSNLNLGARFGIIRNLKDFSGGLRISGEYRTKNGTENLFGASSPGVGNRRRQPPLLRTGGRHGRTQRKAALSGPTPGL